MVFLVGNIYYLGHAALADLIYVEALYKDLFIDSYPLNGWLLSKAPYFFPDWFLFFVIRSFSSHYLLAYAGTVIANLFLLVAGFLLIIKSISELSWKESAIISFFWSAVFLLLLPDAGTGYGPQTIILPVYHSGALICGVFMLTLWLQSLKEPKRILLLSALFLLSTLSTVSDHWWIIWFGVPILLTNFLFVYFENKKIIKSLKDPVFICILSGILLGELISQIIKYAKLFNFSDVPIGGNSNAGLNFIRDLWTMHSATPLIGILFFIMILIFIKFLFPLKNSFKVHGILFFDKLTKQQKMLFGLICICLISYLTTAAPIVILGLWEKWNYRYIHNFIYIPWMLVGTFLAIYFKNNVLNFYTSTMLVVSPFLSAAFIFFNSSEIVKRETFIWTEPLSHFHTVCIDKTADLMGFDRGLSQYWDAKANTYLSRNNQRINQFDNHLRPLHWMNNLYWYSTNKSEINNLPVFDYVVSHIGNDDFEKTLFEKVGLPSFTIPCDSMYVMVYEGDKKRVLNKFIEHSIWEFFTDNEQKYKHLLGKTFLDELDLNTSISLGKPLVAGDSRAIHEVASSVPSIEKQNHRLEWRVIGDSSFAYIYNKSAPELVQNATINYSFKARLLDGTAPIHAKGLAYYKPSGLLDNTAKSFQPITDKTFTITKNWTNINLAFSLPAFGKQKNLNAEVELRPLFIENHGDFELEISALKTSISPIIKKNSKSELLYPVNFSGIKLVLKNVDEFRLNGDRKNEYIHLKLLEKNNKNIPSVTWRLARMYIEMSRTEKSFEIKKANLLKAGRMLGESLFGNGVKRFENVEEANRLAPVSIDDMPNLKVDSYIYFPNSSQSLQDFTNLIKFERMLRLEFIENKIKSNLAVPGYS